MKGPDVYGSAEVCRVLGVTRQRLQQLRQEHADFPPFSKLNIGRVYDGALIRAWQQARTAPRRREMYRLACSYRAHGNVNRAARHVGIHPATARKWLRELDIALPSEKLDVNR